MPDVINGGALWFLLIHICNAVPGLDACTLWAGAGSDVSGGGTLICKNRDRVFPDCLYESSIRKKPSSILMQTALPCFSEKGVVGLRVFFLLNKHSQKDEGIKGSCKTNG